MKTIKQREFGECFPAVCAMIVGKDLDYVLKRVQLTAYEGAEYLGMSEATIFLAQHGIGIGVIFPFPDGRVHAPEFDAHFSVHMSSAIVTVKSDRSDRFTHAILWDNEHQVFRDPRKGWKDCVWARRQCYHIIEWAPIGSFREEHLRD